MSTKKMQKSLDNVKADVRELAQAFWALRDEVLTHHATTAAEQQSSTKRAMPPQTLDGKQPEPGSAGYIGAHGHYEMSDSEGNRSVYRWSLEDHPVEEVLDIEVDDPAKVLGAIGHKQRLGMVLLLLRQPATANDIVHELSLATTGAAYHHLNVLQGAGIVQQEQRGTFSIAPARVPAIMSILTGLSGALEASVETVAMDEPEPGPIPA